MRLKNDEEAINYFKKAAKNFMNVNAMINNAILLSKKGNLQDAIDIFQNKLIKFQPYNAKVLLNYNTLLMQ